jgi:hypothetical protein
MERLLFVILAFFVVKFPFREIRVIRGYCADWTGGFSKTFPQ